MSDATRASASESAPDVSCFVSPRCRKLFRSSLDSSSQPVPSDWNEKLKHAVKTLPDDATVDEVVSAVADFSPDRGLALMEVWEEEVAVMEDALNQLVADRQARLQNEKNSELRVLSTAAKAAQEKALEAHQQILERVPDFDWDRYKAEPCFLQHRCLQEDNMEEEEEIEETIEYSKEEKKYLTILINQLKDRRSLLERCLRFKTEMDLDDELDRLEQENDTYRCLFIYLSDIVKQSTEKEPIRICRM